MDFLSHETSIDMEAVTACLSQKSFEDRLHRDEQLAMDLGITSTPSVFVNGQRISVRSIEDLRNALRTAQLENTVVGGRPKTVSNPPPGQEMASHKSRRGRTDEQSSWGNRRRIGFPTADDNEGSEPASSTLGYLCKVTMNRREFLQTSALGLTGAAFGQAQEYNRDKPRRVGLIGCGWYGKSDLFRLIQVAPVEVVSLCDVDSTDAGGCRRDGGHAAEHRRRSREPIPTTARC